MSDSASQGPAIIQHLLQLAAPGNVDRAALAALRRGLGRPAGTVAEMYPHVQPYVGTDARPGYEDACYIVAALFASHPLSWSPSGDLPRITNLGASFAQIRGRSGSVESRFTALLSCDRRELPDHLRHGVSLLKADGIPIDWQHLLRDIVNWADERRWVQRGWARGFWGQQASQQKAPESEDSAAEEAIRE
jgi:CRISPR system Cascade subunit CasB